MIGNLDKFIRLLVLISFDVKTIKVEVWNKNKNHKLMSLRIDDEKLLEKYKSIWTKIGDLKKLNWMLYQSMMIDISTPNFRGLDVPED